MKPSLCVVYLAREPQAIVPFLDSYQRHPAGVDHKLLFLKKGSHVVLPPEATSMPNHLEYAIADVGCGLRAFSVACRRFDFDYFCCLNSWTQIAADDWLLKLFCAACMPAAGIVGATGSAETSYQLRAGFLNRLNRFLFEPFPNYHVRTTGFVMRRDLMLQTWPRLVPTKQLEYFIEHGRNNITNQIRRMGLLPFVVGKDGYAYSMHQWEAANVYRTHQQENLLLEDNQTRSYARADATTKAQLRLRTWGFTSQNQQNDSSQLLSLPAYEVDRVAA